MRACANCGANAPGAYCPACGQDTRERLPTFARFMREATGRYVALDGKLWKTLWALLARPGFLTREYFAGRRRRYIGPARLFLVSSLVLFAVLRFASEAIEFERNVLVVEPGEPPQAKPDSGEFVGLDDDLKLTLRSLPETIPLLRKPIARFNSLSRPQKVEQIVAGTIRYGPYAMFVLLPAFAALLKLVYLGRRKRHPQRPRLYGEHLVFAAHNHAFLSVVASLLFVVPELAGRALALWALVYLVWSTRGVYGGSWLGIAARGLALITVYSVLFAFVTMGLVIAAVLLR